MIYSYCIKNESYSHIIVDDASNFTKGELDLVKSLYKKKNYTSCIFILDTEIQGVKHNALYDAEVIKACYDKLMKL